MTSTIEDFLGPVIIRSANGIRDTFPVKAYVVDRPPSPGKGSKSLKNKLRMDNFHCCDYIFVPDNNSVLLIEDSNLKRKKEDLEENDLSSVKDTKSKARLSKEWIKNEQLLKAYASLLLLCRLLAQNTIATPKMQGKNIHFWVIINDSGPSDVEIFDYLKKAIASRLRSLVSEVVVLHKDGAKKELSKYDPSTP